MKRRYTGHAGHTNNGGMNHRRHQGGYQGGQPRHSGGFQRPRKNYPALREKYMNMARDAMSSGDRVLAEYYLQHADHYFRMQQEFAAERAARQQQMPQEGAPVDEADEGAMEESDMNITSGNSALPAFLTRPAPAQAVAEGEKSAPPPPAWEEEA